MRQARWQCVPNGTFDGCTNTVYNEWSCVSYGLLACDTICETQPGQSHCDAGSSRCVCGEKITSNVNEQNITAPSTVFNLDGTVDTSPPVFYAMLSVSIVGACLVLGVLLFAVIASQYRDGNNRMLVQAGTRPADARQRAQQHAGFIPAIRM